MVITFYLRRRGVPFWLVVIPMVFMLIMPAWAMLSDLPRWLAAENPNWVVICVGILTLVLQRWMFLEATLVWPHVKDKVEESMTANASSAGGTGQ